MSFFSFLILLPPLIHVPEGSGLIQDSMLHGKQTSLPFGGLIRTWIELRVKEKGNWLANFSFLERRDFFYFDFNFLYLYLTTRCSLRTMIRCGSIGRPPRGLLWQTHIIYNAPEASETVQGSTNKDCHVPHAASMPHTCTQSLGFQELQCTIRTATYYMIPCHFHLIVLPFY